MNLHSNALEEYCLQHSSSRHPLLDHIARETHLKTTKPQMMSGPLQGAWIGQLVSLHKAQNVLEIGTFTGYTTIWIAESLPKNGQVTSIEIDEETHSLANGFFKQYESAHKIHSLLGDAKEIIPGLDVDWDMVLIDAGKKDNGLYYHMLIEKMASGAFFLLDNVLWKGKVLHEKQDKLTEEIDRLNKELANDERVNCLMLPIRDGLTIIQKK